MTLEQAQSLIGEVWSEYEAAGQPYGPIRLGMLHWAKDALGYEAGRTLDFALQIETRHLQEV